MKEMQHSLRLLVPVSLAAAALAGCGSHGSSSDKIVVNDPNRPVATMLANVTSLTFFADATAHGKAQYRATLLDKDGNQFYGPKVTLDGTDVPVSGSDSTAIYSTASPSTQTTDTPAKTIPNPSAINYAPGQTYTTTVQTNSATSLPALPEVQIVSPVKYVETTTDSNQKVTTTIHTYFQQNHGEARTISWTGGDSTQPIYVVIQGNPDNHGDRRLFPNGADPAYKLNDPRNFGIAVPNTGSYTIPATLQEQVLNNDGSVSTRTVTTFDNLNTDHSVSGQRFFQIYVVQRQSTGKNNLPIEFAVLASAYATAAVLGRG